MIQDENEKDFKGSPPSEGCPQDGVGSAEDMLTTGSSEVMTSLKEAGKEETCKNGCYA